MIIDNPEVLRSLVHKHIVTPGNEHSEDLVDDPEVVAWTDAYAEEYRKTVDPVWAQLIENPEYRWYKHGEEYKRLFRFRTHPFLPRRGRIGLDRGIGTDGEWMIRGAHGS